MKYFLFLTFILFVQEAYSFEKKMNVVDRTKSFRAKIMSRDLVDLVSKKSFDGKFFKIVIGKEDKAISFNTDEETLLRAATTYYHLNKARAYFVNDLKSDYVASFKKMTIRIDMKNKFSELGHFAHDNLDPQFNNALSIPAGAGFESRGVKGWDNEIWFRPAKRIHVSEFGGTGADARALQGSLKSFRNDVHMSSFKHFLSNVILNDVVRTYQTPYENVMRTVGSTLIMEAIYQSSGVAASLFARKWYRLDSALVPEIIYHEFAHVALSDNLDIRHSTPVNEGMADYFAGKIANSEKLALKIKKYNVFDGKRVSKRLMYREQFESGDYANSDFVFGLLWHAGDLMKEEGDDKSGESLIYSMRKNIQSDVNIKDQLLEGILDTCSDECVSPRVTKYKLYKLFHYKGL